MRMYVSDQGNWGIINEEIFGFAIVNCEDWSEEDFQELDWATDGEKLITALAIRRERDDDLGISRASWHSAIGLLDQIIEIANKDNNTAIHELAIELNEALGL